MLLFALVTIAIVVGPSVTTAQQLNLSWVDNSGGQTSFIIQRATGTTGTYTQVAQVPLGVTAYTDTTVSLGTTYCYQVAAVNSAGTSSFSNLACGSPSGGFTVTVANAGTGVGTDVTSPAGINCGTICSYTYPAGTVVTLTAIPSSGSTFSGWSGSGCGGTDPCSLVGNVPVTVTATFATFLGSRRAPVRRATLITVAGRTYTLTVTKKGPGTVRNSPAGINCGSTCSASYPSGRVITLRATPGRKARFIGWSGGGCSGTGTCTLMLTTNVSVLATFSQK